MIKGIRSRIEGTLDEPKTGWRDKYGGALSNFIGGIMVKGATVFLDGIEPEAVENVNDVLKQIKDMPETPASVKNLVDRMQPAGSPVPLLIVIPLAIIIFIPMILSIMQPLGNLFKYVQERVFHSYRLGPDTVTQIWLRDKAKYEDLWGELKDLGWSDRKIDVAKELAKIIPPLADMVRFADFGSFDPKIIELWRQFYDAPSWISEPMSLLGITNEKGRDWANKYWFSHWRQPGRFELGEIYRRGLLGKPLIGQDEVGGGETIGPAEELVKNAYLTQGFSEFWQDHLLQLVREVPTRVDVRRWWDFRTITEEELREIYQRQGYFGKDLENYVIWTKVYTAFPDLIARWSKGWITLEDVRSELTALGMPVERIEELIETKVKAEQPERTSGERDLTKTDIYKGVKQDRISRGQGLELLMELGYDEDEADYLLSINIPEDQVDTVVKERELTKADILKGLRTEVLTEAEARTKLLDLRYSSADVQLLLDIFNASIKPPAEPRERQASKADIVLAVKKDLITPEEGYLMLLDLGFTPAASEFILLVKAESSPFSAVNFSEFKDLTGKWRKAAGMTTPAFNDKLREAADDLVRISDEVRLLQDGVRTEKMLLVDMDVIPEENEKRLKDLQVALNRAIAEKQRLQDVYNTLVAEFRQAEA